MIDLKILAPRNKRTDKLREDLHAILSRHHAYFVGSNAYFSSYVYSVQQSWLYRVMDRNHNVVGEVIVLTNDFNHFEEDASHIPGGKIYYSAKVVFTGFNPNRTEFIRLKQSFDHLNAHYQKESSKLSLL